MSSPLAVIRYLAELDRALATACAPDRDQIVQQISEHIDEALAEIADPSGGDPSDDDVRAVLAELGDPLKIAQEPIGADAANTTPSPDASAPSGGGTWADPPGHAPPYRYYPAPPKPPLMTRPWVPLVAVVLFLLSEVQMLAPAAIGATSPMFAMPWSTIGLLTIVLNLWWWASLAIAIISPLFRTGEAVTWGLVLPIVALVVPLVVLDLLGSPDAGDAAFGYVLAFGLPVLAAALAVWITTRARRRARELADAPPAGPATAAAPASTTP